MNSLLTLFCGIIFLFPFQGIGQHKYSFVGFVKSEAIGIIPYKLQFSVLEFGAIEGESHYDFNGKNKTSSKILGSIDLKKKEVVFREVENISTKANGFDESDFCFIVSQVLNLKGKEGKEVISGAFKSAFKDGKECISGQLYLANEQAVNTLLSQIEQSDSTMSELVRNFKNQDGIQDESNMESMVFRNKDSLNFSFEGDTVAFFLWDDDEEDYDRVRIYRDSEVFIEDLLISNQKREFKIANLEGSSQIQVKAINVGYSPPNTVSMILQDGENTKTFSANLNKGESMFINLKKRDKL